MITLKRKPVGRVLGAVKNAEGKFENPEIDFQGFGVEVTKKVEKDGETIETKEIKLDKGDVTLEEVLTAVSGDEKLLAYYAALGYNEHAFEIASDPFAAPLEAVAAEHREGIRIASRDLVKQFGKTPEQAVSIMRKALGV